MKSCPSCSDFLQPLPSSSTPRRRGGVVVGRHPGGNGGAPGVLEELRAASLHERLEQPERLGRLRATFFLIVFLTSG